MFEGAIGERVSEPPQSLGGLLREGTGAVEGGCQVKNEVKIKCIEIKVEGGEMLDSAMRKACMTALNHDAEVCFYHNQRRFFVLPSAIIESVKQSVPQVT
jgi:hypothetical protein